MNDTIRMEGDLPVPDNSEEGIRQRRAQNTLIIVGTGVILFGGWTVLKSAGMWFISRDDFAESVRKTFTASSSLLSEGQLYAIALAAGIIYLLAGLLIRLIIGFSAIAAGRGRRPGFLYIPLTILMILASFLQLSRGIGLYRSAILDGADPQDASLAGLIIELTSMIMMIEMLAAARKRGQTPL